MWKITNNNKGIC